MAIAEITKVYGIAQSTIYLRFRTGQLTKYKQNGLTFVDVDELEKKIKQYNALMVLDFDDVEALDALKEDLKNLPWVYYAGLSVSGTGIFAIVPLDTDDYRMHRTFFDALEAEMKEMGYKVDPSCKDVTRMRFVSYDPNPYFNEDCILYSLPEDFLADDDTQELEDEPESREITSNERLELYVQEWERKKIALDGPRRIGISEIFNGNFVLVFEGIINPLTGNKIFAGPARVEINSSGNECSPRVFINSRPAEEFFAEPIQKTQEPKGLASLKDENEELRTQMIAFQKRYDDIWEYCKDLERKYKELEQKSRN